MYGLVQGTYHVLGAGSGSLGAWHGAATKY